MGLEKENTLTPQSSTTPGLISRQSGLAVPFVAFGIGVAVGLWVESRADQDVGRTLLVTKGTVDPFNAKAGRDLAKHVFP